MKGQIVETWRIHNRVHLKLVEAIDDEGFQCTLSKRGGRNVGLQFAHIHNVRLWRFERYAKELFEGQRRIAAADPFDRELLARRLTESGEAVAVWLQQGIDAGGAVKGFRRGVVPMLGYLIAHESHHRGSILLTLKQCGHPVPKEIRDGIWAWNQI